MILVLPASIFLPASRDLDLEAERDVLLADRDDLLRERDDRLRDLDLDEDDRLRE